MAEAQVVRGPLTRPRTGSEPETESGRAFLQERLSLLAKIWPSAAPSPSSAVPCRST